jgi:CRP-like cAMP-binding protein
VSEDNSVPINQLLAALPRLEYQRLAPHLQPVSLSVGQILHEPGETIREVYFPNRAMISLVSMMEDGSTTEIGLVGNEGMVGLPVFLGGKFTTSLAIVQISDGAMKLDAEVLKEEFHRGGELQRRLLLYTQALLTQVSQSAACNRQHTIEERLARWLLSVQDRVQKDELPLTQEFIANMLGIRRSGVTVAATTLQRAGMIRYSRGKITILDQENLEATACECYRLVQSEFIRLLGSRRS